MTLLLVMNLGFAWGQTTTPTVPHTFGHRSGPIVPADGGGRSGPIVHVAPKREM
jgi:hypothetical protein